MAEQERAFGYICPDCGKPVYGRRTAFALNASAVAVVCDCGHSQLTAESNGQLFRVTTPCGICGGEHRAEVPVSSVLSGKGVGLACPQTKQFCCYIGDPGRVERSLREMEITAQKKQEGDDAFVDNVIMYEVLSELRDISARQGISCACGGKRCTMEVRGAWVDLVCADCGGRLRVSAATDEDLDQLCCNYTLTIPGKK